MKKQGHSAPNHAAARSRRSRPIKLAIKPLVSLTFLPVLFGLGGSLWIMQAAIAPLTAQAYTARVTIELDGNQDASYEALMRRAENIARAAVQRSFDADILATAATVTVVGEKDGFVAPILSVEVSRNQWRSRPDAAYWGEYFRDARSLLGFTTAAE
jgi:hypothetical protein